VTSPGLTALDFGCRGVTPTEYRRRALAVAAAAKPLGSKDNFEIGKSA